MEATKKTHVPCGLGGCILCQEGEAAFRLLPKVNHTRIQKSQNFQILTHHSDQTPEAGYYEVEIQEVRRTPDGNRIAIYTIKKGDWRSDRIPEDRVFHGRLTRARRSTW